MPLTIDFLDNGRVLEWEATVDGAVVTEHDDYTPRFYVAPRSLDGDIDFTQLRRIYENHLGVVATEVVSRRPGFRRDEEEVLAVDVTHVDRVTPLARQARQLSEFPIGNLACFNVDFSREFRYSLENDIDPTPARELSTLRLGVPVTETTGNGYTVCLCCGAESSLDVHHVDGNPTNDDLENLVVLCESCHRSVHNRHRENTTMSFLVDQLGELRVPELYTDDFKDVPSTATLTTKETALGLKY